MKYLKSHKIFEELTSHWANELYPKLKFERKDDIEDLLYDFKDLGFRVEITPTITPNDNSSHLGKKSEFISSGKNLYEGYRIYLVDKQSRSKDIDMIIYIKEREIELLNRLRGMGFIMEVHLTQGIIKLYHPKDVIDKKLYLDDKRRLSATDSLVVLKERLDKRIGRIANIQLAPDEESIYITTIGPYFKGKVNEYTLDRIYDILVTSVISRQLDVYDVKKVAAGILIRMKCDI